MDIEVFDDGKYNIDGKYLYYCVSTVTGREFILYFNQDIETHPELVQNWLPEWDSYPLGTFLMRCVNCFRNFMPITEDIPLTDQLIVIKYIIEEYFVDRPPICGFDSKEEFDLLLGLILDDFKKMDDVNINQKLTKISNYISFIELCNENEEFCNYAEFSRFSILNNELLTKMAVVPIDNFIFQNEYLQSDLKIKHLLNEAKELPNRDDNFMKLYTSIFVDEWQKDIYHYYHIDSITSFLSAALQEVFSAKKRILTCKYCMELFIPEKRTDTLYCKGYNSISPERSCKAQAKLDRQLARVRASESRRIYNSIRTMMEARCDDLHAEPQQILNNFLSEAYEKRQKIKSGDLSEDEYVAWLKTHYRRKGKQK